MQLGDKVEQALAWVGVTEDRVRGFLGTGCGGCKERKEALNALGAWASKSLRSGKVEAKKWLDQVLGEVEDDQG